MDESHGPTINAQLDALHHVWRIDRPLRAAIRRLGSRWELHSVMPAQVEQRLPGAVDQMQDRQTLSQTSSAATRS